MLSLKHFTLQHIIHNICMFFSFFFAAIVNTVLTRKLVTQIQQVLTQYLANKNVFH